MHVQCGLWGSLEALELRGLEKRELSLVESM
jgi:hypothetical protein